MMTAQRIFEELSFIWELLAAEFVILLPFARRKKGFEALVLVGVPAFSLLSFGFFAIVLVGKCVGPASDNYQIVGIDCFYAVPKAVL